MGRILVVGATGLIGAPVAWRLLADGHHVRLLVRDTGRASTRLGAGFEYVQGSVTDTEAIDRAVQGMNGVHISLGVEDPAQLEPVEHQGTATVAAAAARQLAAAAPALGPDPLRPGSPRQRRLRPHRRRRRLALTALVSLGALLEDQADLPSAKASGKGSECSPTP